MKRGQITASILTLSLILYTLCGCSPASTGDTTGDTSADGNQMPISSSVAEEMLPAEQKTITETAEPFEKESLYLENEETNRSIYSVQVKPTGVDAGQKVPMVIYVHGGSGNANSLLPIAKKLAAYGVGGVLFECCGGNNGKTSEPKSDGGELYPAHYSSRISDLETVLSYVKGLDFVDPEQVYVFGESYGGLVACLSAPRHNQDLAGIILASTGLQESVFSYEDHNGAIESYIPETPYSYIKDYTGPVLFLCGDADETGAYNATLQTNAIYEERVSGTTQVVTIEGGGHGYGSFTEEQKAVALSALVEWLLAAS